MLHSSEIIRPTYNAPLAEAVEEMKVYNLIRGIKPKVNKTKTKTVLPK